MLRSTRVVSSGIRPSRKLQAEAAHEARKSDPRARQAAVAAYKTALKTLKHHIKRRGSP